MNKREVLGAARNRCGENRHNQVLGASYYAKYGRDIDPEVLANHVHALKTRGRVPPYLREQIEGAAQAKKTRRRALPAEAALTA